MDVFLEIYRGFNHMDDTLRCKTEKGQMVTKTLDFDDAHEQHISIMAFHSSIFPFFTLSFLIIYFAHDMPTYSYQGSKQFLPAQGVMAEGLHKDLAFSTFTRSYPLLCLCQFFLPPLCLISKYSINPFL